MLYGSLRSLDMSARMDGRNSASRPCEYCTYRSCEGSGFGFGVAVSGGAMAPVRLSTSAIWFASDRRRAGTEVGAGLGGECATVDQDGLVIVWLGA